MDFKAQKSFLFNYVETWLVFRKKYASVLAHETTLAVDGSLRSEFILFFNFHSLLIRMRMNGLYSIKIYKRLQINHKDPTNVII